MNDGGPAFPTDSWGEGCLSGISARDYFAAAALTGYLAWSPVEDDRISPPESCAAYSYSVADAMLRERNRDGKEGGLDRFWTWLGSEEETLTVEPVEDEGRPVWEADAGNFRGFGETPFAAVVALWSKVDPDSQK